MLRPGHLIALCVLALLTLGVIMVNSAGMSVASKEAAVTVESILLSRSTAYMFAALAAMAACAALPIRRLTPKALRGAVGIGGEDGQRAEEVVGQGGGGLSNQAREIARHWLGLAPMWACVGGLLLVLTLVYVPGLGRTVNGSSRWISLPAPGLESIQPSEIAKWGLLVLLAWYATAHTQKLKRFFGGLAPALAAAGLLAAFIVVEDLGTGVLIAGVAAVVLLAAGARWWHMALMAPVPLLGIIAAIATSDYRRARLLAFLDPYEHPQTIGYHMIQSMVAVANGQVAGRGLGHGLQKFDYLPEDKTDFLFAIICEELGIVGCLMVVGIYIAMLWTALGIIRNERWSFYKLLGLGVIATVGFQAVINLFVVTGLGPTKGIALPLLSSGGTGWILTAGSLGLLIAMDRTQGQAAIEALLGRGRSRDHQLGAGLVGAEFVGACSHETERAPVGQSPMTQSDVSQAAHVPVATSVLNSMASLASADDAEPLGTMVTAEAPEPEALPLQPSGSAMEQVWPTTTPARLSTPRPHNTSRITILTSPGEQGWLFSGPDPTLGAPAAAAPPISDSRIEPSVFSEAPSDMGRLPRELKPRVRLQLQPAQIEAADASANSEVVEPIAREPESATAQTPLASGEVVITDAARTWLDESSAIAGSTEAWPSAGGIEPDALSDQRP